MRKFWIALLIVPILVLASMPAEAKPQIVSWQMPTQDCDGVALAQADLLEFELIFDTSPMPMPSDAAGACDPVADPEAPATATTVPVPVAETSTILNLKPGETYYFRCKVSAYVNGNWSSWSIEISKTVPYGRPDRVIVSDGMLRYEADLITDPIIQLKFGA